MCISVSVYHHEVKLLKDFLLCWPITLGLSVSMYNSVFVLNLSYKNDM